jgi:hypothetical protein
MSVIQVQDEFQSGDNVTASSLNDLVNDASFVNGAVDNSTLQVASAGHLKVKDNGILSNHLKSDATNDSVRAVTTNHIRNDAVTNAKIADLAVDTDQIAADAVTYAKIQNVSATNRVLGRDSSGAGNVEEISPSALRTMINVENGATADQTASEIKTAYESNADTNAFTNSEQSKLSGIEAGATADQTASEIKTAYESNADTNAFTNAEQTKLSGIEANATADQSASEIKTAYESNTNTNAFTDAEKTKLTGIAAGAEVNVQSDWNATTGDALILNKPTIPTVPGDATTSASGLMSATDKTKLNGLSNFSLDVADASTLGGVKEGGDIDIDANGVMTVSSTATSALQGVGGWTFVTHTNIYSKSASTTLHDAEIQIFGRSSPSIPSNARYAMLAHEMNQGYCEVWTHGIGNRSISATPEGFVRYGGGDDLDGGSIFIVENLQLPRVAFEWATYGSGGRPESLRTGGEYPTSTTHSNLIPAGHVRMRFGTYDSGSLHRLYILGYAY